MLQKDIDSSRSVDYNTSAALGFGAHFCKELQLEIIISARHNVEMTPDLKQYAQERAEKLLRYFDGITKIVVTLGSDQGRHTAEINISARRHLQLIGEVQRRDLREAIDLVTDKMERQLTRHKEKLKSHRDRKNIGEAPAAEAEDAEDAEDYDDFEGT